MKKPFAAALLLTAMSITPPVMAAEIKITTTNPVIELSVTEQIESTPDTATFSTGVETKAPTATQALRQNSAAVQKVINQLKALGIDAKDIQTTGINLNPEYRWIQDQNINEFVGYQVSNQVQAKVRGIDKIGSILDAVVASGATNVSGPWFSLSDDSAVKANARKQALARARAQALEYAQASGYKNVRVLSIAEGLFNNGPAPMPMMAMKMEAASDARAPVEPGQVGTAVSLSISFEMLN